MSSTLHCKDEIRLLPPCAVEVILNRVQISLEVAFMPDVMRALAISGGILLIVVLVVVLVSYVTVRRGEAAMAEDARRHGRSAH